MPDEEPLAGGNVSAGVVRVGDTVRRPAGPWTPAVHALLTYLRASGFDGAPEPLGLDDKGREVLRFIPGTVAWGEGFRLLQPASELARAGRLIRDFHDAVTGFAPPSDGHERQQLALMLGPRARSMYQFLADRAAQKIEPWARLWHQGHGEAWRSHADFIDGQTARWQTALLA